MSDRPVQVRVALPETGCIASEAEHVQRGSGTADKTVENAVLDAARSCILEFGVRRTTLAEIARRAKVSRPTVYRRWSDTRAVVSSLLTREISGLIPPFDDAVPARGRIVAAIGEVADKVRLHPLFAKIQKSDSDVLVTYILHRLGTSQSIIIDALMSLIVLGHNDSSIRSGDPTTMAVTVLLMVQSAVQSAEMVSERVAGVELMGEMAYAVDAYLRPRNC